MRQKIVERLQYEGLGFPIILLNVPVRTFRDEEIPDIDYNRLQQCVFESLSHKPQPLTGNEVRFIRQYLEMTLVQFARHFGLTHPAVLKWEKAGDQIAKITPSTELYIRLYILEILKVKNEKFRNAFVAFDSNEKLKKSAQSTESHTTKPVQIDAELVSA